MRSPVNQHHLDTQAARTYRLGLIAAAAALFASASVFAATPYPTTATPAAVDLGASSEAPVTITVALKPANQGQLVNGNPL